MDMEEEQAEFEKELSRRQERIVELKNNLKRLDADLSQRGEHFGHKKCAG